ncbi:MAG: HAMP domain-containing sensor histidine kinase [Cyanobacteria bacterium J06581_3]
MRNFLQPPEADQSIQREDIQLEAASSEIPRWKRFLGETRTRILLLYALLLLLLSGIAVPLFRYLLFSSVDSRVRESIEEEQDAFFDAYADWEIEPNQTVEDLKDFVQQFLQNTIPEDDNFQIVLIDGELYRSSPFYLIDPLASDTELFGRWQSVTEPLMEREGTDLPSVGSILYVASPIVLDGEQRGVFVVAHSTAGERQEALVGVYLFAMFAIATVGISLLISWFAAGRLLLPIATLSKTAQTISESDLTQRISPPTGHNELSDLTHTFNAMMDRIQGAFDSQRAFVNDAGHELRTPITIIQGHLELMDGDPQERQETMELVMNELDRMGRLVSDMILLAKSERPNFLQLKTFSVRTFVEELLVKARALADRDWLLVGDAQGQMTGDRQKLTGAMLNLLRNAAQHTQAADSIEIGYHINTVSSQKHHQDARVEFWVRDSGEGISPDDQARIFARFARGRHQKRPSEGSGLGLAIASAIAEAHGGYITLVSQPGKGATFRIILPEMCQLAGCSGKAQFPNWTQPYS